MREARMAAIQQPLTGIFLLALLAMLWMLAHHYEGLTRDGELYAVQAMARINPALNADVYLSGVSQDSFTIFSPLYAFLIRGLGLWNAGVFLFICCKLLFLGSAWVLARLLWNARVAWLCAAMLLITISYYGGYSVFHYSENYLTARSLGEALVVMALAAWAGGRYVLSWCTLAAAMFVHPLMALPGVLVLICLSVPLRGALFGAAAGLVVLALFAAAAAVGWLPSNIAPLIDGPWLKVVQERSQFLFLDAWRWRDWEMHARPFICLAIGLLVNRDDRIRRLCLAAVLVGASGLLLAFIAGSLGPVALLLQGQAWRWFWLTGFVSALMIAPTALALWRDGGCGQLAATALVVSWTFWPLDGTWIAAGALLLYSLRSRLSPVTQRWCRGLALTAALVVTIATVWRFIAVPGAQSTDEPAIIAHLRTLFALQIPAVLLFGAGWTWISSKPNPLPRNIALVSVLAACGILAHDAFRARSSAGSVREIAEFSSWRSVIPPSSNVAVIPARKSAAFIWFSLQRPSYLTVDQSSGVVFSRATAAEIRRRSEVMLPVIDPDWRIASRIAHSVKSEATERPLTAHSLQEICRDPQLGFVAASHNVGFDPIRHDAPGPWHDWYLYDCAHLRTTGSL